jgi:hypothetical protein
MASTLLFLRHQPFVTTHEASTLGLVLHSCFIMQVRQHNLCLCLYFVTCQSSNFMLSYYSIPFMHYILIHPLSIHYISLSYLSFNYYCNQTQHINYFQLLSYSLFFLSIPTCLPYLITHFYILPYRSLKYSKQVQTRYNRPKITLARQLL